MKRQLLIGLMLLNIVYCTQVAMAQEMDDPIAEVSKLEGVAKAIRPNNNERALALHSPLYTQDILATGKKSYVGIRFTDGTLSAIRPNTTVEIGDYYFTQSSKDYLQLRLSQGGIYLISGKIAKNNPYGIDVVTPVGNINLTSTNTDIFYKPRMGLAFFGKGLIKNKRGELRLTKASHVIVDSNSSSPQVVTTPPAIFNDAEGTKANEWVVEDNTETISPDKSIDGAGPIMLDDTAGQ